MTGFTGTGLDFDNTVGDLRNFELEQTLDKPGVGTTNDNLRAFSSTADLNDVGLDPVATLISGSHRDLLGLGQECFNSTKVEQRVAGVGLLNDSGDNVTFTSGILLVLHLPFDLTDSLGQDLLGCLGGNTTKGVRGYVHLRAEGLTVLVQLLGKDADIKGGGINGYPCVLVGVGHSLVGRLQSVGHDAEQLVNRDTPVFSQGSKGLCHLVAH